MGYVSYAIFRNLTVCSHLPLKRLVIFTETNIGLVNFLVPNISIILSRSSVTVKRLIFSLWCLHIWLFVRLRVDSYGKISPISKIPKRKCFRTFWTSSSRDSKVTMNIFRVQMWCDTIPVSSLAFFQPLSIESVDFRGTLHGRWWTHRSILIDPSFGDWCPEIWCWHLSERIRLGNQSEIRRNVGSRNATGNHQRQQGCQRSW